MIFCKKPLTAIIAKRQCASNQRPWNPIFSTEFTAALRILRSVSVKPATKTTWLQMKCPRQLMNPVICTWQQQSSRNSTFKWWRSSSPVIVRGRSSGLCERKQIGATNPNSPFTVWTTISISISSTDAVFSTTAEQTKRWTRFKHGRKT